MTTRQISSDEGRRRAAQPRRGFGGAMRRGGLVERRDGPPPFENDCFVGDGNGRRDRDRLVNRFVDGGAVNPDHLAVVVLDLGALAERVNVLVRIMRREVAVSDGVVVFVPGAGLVDVCGRQCRGERQKRDDQCESRGTTHGATNHAGIIE